MRTAPIPAAAVALILVTASVAAAGPTASDPRSRVGNCPAGTLCVWTKPEFTGDMTEFLDGNWAGRCRSTRTPIKSVANLTTEAPWRMQLFLFHNPRSSPCNRRGVYAQYPPGQIDRNVAGGPVTGVQIYAEPNPAANR